MGIITIDELRKLAADFVAAEPQRIGSEGFWLEPLMASCPIDDRFEILPQITFAEHLHPHDLLASAKSLIVFYLPFRRKLVQENKRGDRPCRNWGVAYVQTNALIERLSKTIAEKLAAEGHASSLTPATHNFDETVLMARWSHKHLAYLANLGRFGVHQMLITPAGCTGRLGSLVTEAELGAHPLVHGRESCLLKAGEKCGKCIEACPIGALDENGFDRFSCWHRVRENDATLDYFSDLPGTVGVCAKCAALMPCSFKDPVAALR